MNYSQLNFFPPNQDTYNLVIIEPPIDPPVEPPVEPGPTIWTKRPKQSVSGDIWTKQDKPYASY